MSVLSIPTGKATTVAPRVSHIYATPFPLHIGILMDHPSPHMVALLDALAERHDCITEVVYCNKAARERHWVAPPGRLPHRYLKGFNLWKGSRFNPGILSVLNDVRADVWIVNTVYTSLTTLAAAWWLGRKRLPMAFMNEPVRIRGRIIAMLKTLPLNVVLERAEAILATGEKAVAIYRELVKGERVFGSIPYYVDLGEFLQLPPPSITTGGQGVEFLACSQMEPRKGLDVLLRACELLPEEGWGLTLVGDGGQRRRLEEEFGKRWSKERVRFAGKVPFEQRSRAFAGKHVLVLPSRWDGWGMVVPEALAAALPVISSDRVISAHEFVRNGENGFIIPTDNPEALAARMSWFLRNAPLIPRMGRAARKSLVDYRPEVGAERLVRCASELVSRKDLRFDGDGSPDPGCPPRWKRLTAASFPRRLYSGGRDSAKSLAVGAALALAPRRKPDGNRILVYHLVLEEDKQRFRDHMRFLSDHFELCSLVDLVRGLKERNPDSLHRLAVTFDDGFRVLMEDCLAVLEEFRIKASFFVSTGFVELCGRPGQSARFSIRAHPHFTAPLDPMRPEDLQTLVALGHDVGSHGVSHTSIRAMAASKAGKELEISRRKIFEWTGQQPRGFAFPYGHTTSSVLDPAACLRSAGYEFGLTLRRGKAGARSNLMLLPRDHCEGNWSIKRLRYFLFS